MDKDQEIRTHMAEMITLCEEMGIMASSDTVKVRDEIYYATFEFRKIDEKECPRCKGKGKIPLKPSKV